MADHPQGRPGHGEGLASASGSAFSPTRGPASAAGEAPTPRAAPEVELGRPEALPPRPETQAAHATGPDVGEQGSARATGSTSALTEPVGEGPVGEGSAAEGSAAEGSAGAGSAGAGSAGEASVGAGSAAASAGAAATHLSDDATQQLDRGDDSAGARAPSGTPEGTEQGDDTATLSPPRAEPARPARPAGATGATAAGKTAAQPPRTAPSRSPAQRGSRPTLGRHATVRRIDPWSVLKLSLVFYFCVLLVVMLGLTVFWTVVNQLGIIEQLLGFLEDLQFMVSIDGGMIARAVFLVGLLNVVLWSGINVFLAFLYNLVADLVGGLRVTVAEDQPG